MSISNKAKRELFLIFTIIGSVFLLYASVFGDGGYMQLRRHRDALGELRRENLRLRENHRAYLQRIKKLKSEPAEIERIARERYNFARPGDIIIRLPEQVK